MNKVFMSLLVVTSLHQALNAQSVSINNSGAPAHASAILDVSANDKGMLIPRMTSAERIAIPSPAQGLMLFDTDTNSYAYYNGTTWETMAASGNTWKLTGNTNTNPSTSFIGTTDNLPLRLRVNNTWSGEIQATGGNTFFGLLAGSSAVTGLANTAIGQNTMPNVTTGTFNTALGINTLSNNISGGYNTAIGERVLQYNTSAYNAAMGAEAMRNNSSGSNNTAVGAIAMYGNTVGFFNTACGYEALKNNSAGTTLTALGYGADILADFLSNATAIGSGAKVDASNKVRIGNSSVTSIGGQVGWTNFSDGRYKQSVKEDIKGLSFIQLLRPVSYNIDLPGLDKYYQPKNVSNASDLLHAATYRQAGFIAQEVEAAAQKLGFNFSGVDKPSQPSGLYGLRYAEFVVPLVKAVQEQQLIIERLTRQVEASSATAIPEIVGKQELLLIKQQEELNDLKARLIRLESKLK
ncbi:MAG: tail fiber domain-containing protein [Ferruginibacter sp.]